MGGSGSKEASENDDSENDTEKDKNHPDNKKCDHEGWDDLKQKPRHCTDSIFLVLLIACWIAMTIVGFIVTGVIEDDHLSKGNPNRLTNSIDYEGNLCGFDTGVKSKPYAYYLPDTSGKKSFSFSHGSHLC